MRNLILIAAAAVTLSGCDQSSPTTAKDHQAAQALAAANSINFDQNAEIENIKRRLVLTSQPGLLGYIVLLNSAGQPIMYTAVKGKITSSGKRLTPPVKEWNLYGDHNSLGDAPSDEGTWGHSDDYVYFWAPDGQYYQWKGEYLYSDQPFRLKISPLIVGGDLTKLDTPAPKAG